MTHDQNARKTANTKPVCAADSKAPSMRAAYRAIVEELFKQANQRQAASDTRGEMRRLNLERIEAAYGPDTRALAELEMRVEPFRMTLVEFERQMSAAVRKQRRPNTYIADR
jgi:hypothetical protein